MRGTSHRESGEKIKALEPWPSESPGAGREELVAKRAEEEQERHITLRCQRVRREC